MRPGEAALHGQSVQLHRFEVGDSEQRFPDFGRAVGDQVNLEVDVIAKYVERLLDEKEAQ